MLKIIEKNIIESNSQFIAHQCNCITNQAAGVAKTIFDAFPYSNCYKDRPFPYDLKEIYKFVGKIQVCGDGKENRFVINMFSQIFPGSSKYSNGNDSQQMREKYFIDCLDLISQIPNIQNISFPWRIGCNLGGGNWNNYLDILRKFSEKDINVDICCIDIEYKFFK